jgi:hypothetical protein
MQIYVYGIDTQCLRCGNSQYAPLLRNGLRTCGIYSATKNEILSFAVKWMVQENIILHESQDKKAKATFSLYLEYRSNTNTELLWKKGHAKGKSHMREECKNR